jgi:hypothetical protein
VVAILEDEPGRILDFASDGIMMGSKGNDMVKKAADVVQKIDSLPSGEQELLAQYLSNHFYEVLDEARWEQLFSRSSSTLDQFAAEVDEAIRTGQVAELNPDEL